MMPAEDGKLDDFDDDDEDDELDDEEGEDEEKAPAKKPARKSAEAPQHKPAPVHETGTPAKEEEPGHARRDAREEACCQRGSKRTRQEKRAEVDCEIGLVQEQFRTCGEEGRSG